MVLKGQFRITKIAKIELQREVTSSEVIDDLRSAVQKLKMIQSARPKSKQVRVTQLGFVGANQILGEEDCAFNQTYHTTVTCETDNA